MSWSEPLVTPEDYGSRVDSRDQGAPRGPLQAQLNAVADHLQARLGRRFGRTDADELRYFTPSSFFSVRLDDLVSLADDGFAVDSSGDGVYDALDADDFVLLPRNAAAYGQPYLRAELKRTTSFDIVTGGFGAWPTRPDAIRVNGIWGWPATPGAFVELVVMTTRQLRDLQRHGLTTTANSIDTAVQMAPGASSLMKDLRKGLGRKAFVL